jgi:hypothetical protein
MYVGHRILHVVIFAGMLDIGHCGDNSRSEMQRRYKERDDSLQLPEST